VSYIRRVGAAGDVFRNLGTIVVDVPVDTILKRMGDSAIKGGILEIRLLNEKGELVARTGMGDEGAVLPSAKGLRLNQALPYPAWEFSALISVQGLAQARRAILISFALTLLVVSAIAVAATLGFSKTIASRIDTLEDLATKVMVDPAVADLASFNEASFYDDEISHLQTYFVALLNRNRELLRQEHEKVLAEKDARLHALQMQIDPHFLYNTLDTINWAALENGQKEVSRLIGQLSTYYRLSLHNGQDVVALRNELEHVRAFLSLYEKRMAGLLWVEYDIDEAVFPYSTVKLILQPLAENAIIHGIRNTPSQSGTIRIQGRLLADRIEISVADDGIGFPMDRYRALMADPSQGFAVKNVDQRIKLFCGPEYGLRYDFGTPRGSCAVVSLSLRRG
jgi:two-component system sensor histidine kinase YesM